MKKFNYSLLVILCVLFFSNNTLYAQSLDVKVGEETLKVTPSARLFLDGAAFIQDESDLSNGVKIPDVRLGFAADYGKWSGKVDIGFGNGKVSAKDVFLQYNLNKTSYLRAGNYKEPFGMDRMESSTRIKFMTNNATSNTFAPGRRIGVSYVGWSNMLWFSGGFFGDGGAMSNSKDGDHGYSATSRLVFNPLKKTGAIFHLGLAGTMRKADANGREEIDGILKDNARKIGYSGPLLSNIENIKPLSASISDANYEAKYAVELVAAHGPVSLQSEYFHTNVRRYNNAATYQAKGAYAQVGFLAMGGNYAYSSSSALLGRPSPKSLELVGRFNYTDLDDKASNIYGGTMRDWSIAANYYLNKYIMFRVNYSYINLGDYNPALAGENVHAVQGRIQVVF